MHWEIIGKNDLEDPCVNPVQVVLSPNLVTFIFYNFQYCIITTVNTEISKLINMYVRL